MSRDTFEVVTLGGRGGAMASSGERPGMLLGVLQRMASPHPPHLTPGPDGSSADGGKPYSFGFFLDPLLCLP